MPIDPKFQPFVSALGGLLARAAEAATESVLDEVQDKVREIDTRISSARQKAKARRKPSGVKVAARRDKVVDAEIVDEKEDGWH